jgi:hypothetical protein
VPLLGFAVRVRSDVEAQPEAVDLQAGDVAQPQVREIYYASATARRMVCAPTGGLRSGASLPIAAAVVPLQQPGSARTALRVCASSEKKDFNESRRSGVLGVPGP